MTSCEAWKGTDLLEVIELLDATVYIVGRTPVTVLADIISRHPDSTFDIKALPNTAGRYMMTFYRAKKS
jgi:hypothetical protein